MSSNTVLIVDDSDVERIAFCRAFERHGIRAVSTGDVTEVLPLALGFEPDFILLDLYMPNKTGFEICAQLKKDDRTQNIPIMFVTASDDVNDAVKSIHFGVIDYIHKPTSIDQLVATVLKHKVINTIQSSWQPFRQALMDFSRKYPA